VPSARLGDLPNVTRAVNLPLGSFVIVSPGEAAIPFSDPPEPEGTPDFRAFDSGHLVIEYDAGATVDSFRVGTTLTVPPDYASGGSFAITLRGVNIAPQTEQISCRVSVTGSLAGDDATTPLAGTSGQQVLVLTPTPADPYDPGDSVGLSCHQSNPAADDAVDILSVEFRYTATP
jgi:hypothetical protein